MKRKLIQMAGKTMVVSLPAAWVKKYGLKKGEEIDIEEKGSSILLSTEKTQSTKKVKIDVSEKEDSFAWVSIFSAYIQGADEIEILFNKKEEKKLILEICSTLIGFAITNESSRGVITKDVSGNASEFEPILRRVFFILLSMGKEGLESVEKGSFKELEEFKKKDHDINYSINFCMRYLNKKGYKNHSLTCPMYSTVRDLEKLGDEYADLYRYITLYKIKLRKEVVQLLKDVNEYFENFYGLFYKYDESIALRLIKNKNKSLAETESLAKLSLKEEAIVLSYIRSIITSIFGLIELKMASLNQE